MTVESTFFWQASRGVGREIASYLTQQNRRGKRFRTQAAREELEAMGIKVALGDALNVEDVERAMLGDEQIHAVISTIGGLPKDGESRLSR